MCRVDATQPADVICAAQTDFGQCDRVAPKRSRANYSCEAVVSHRLADAVWVLRGFAARFDMPLRTSMVCRWCVWRLAGSYTAKSGVMSCCWPVAGGLCLASGFGDGVGQQCGRTRLCLIDDVVMH